MRGHLSLPRPRERNHSTPGGTHKSSSRQVSPSRFYLTSRERDVARGRAFAHGTMGRRIDPSWGGPIELFFRSSQCSMTGVTKAMVCVILSVGWCI